MLKTGAHAREASSRQFGLQFEDASPCEWVFGVMALEESAELTEAAASLVVDPLPTD
ncbi:MAG TPA: hypothetical protein VKC61_18280 [Pyrinomonadaceae bacterium]|nr:hypothetical protein [Pyrinomonadaceae bacterium]